jgi:AAHS family 3-hydroxyphenylpropionic acid transporter
LLLTDSRKETSSQRTRTALTLCYLGIVVEGFDISAGGQIAGKVASAFGLSHAALGLSFSMNALGLLLGAVVCGWMADRWGRKAVVVGCFLVFGVMSIATTATTGPVAYFAVRFLTGLGLGGSVPNLIAIAAESGGVSSRMSRVTILSSGLPLGGALCATFSFLLPLGFDWRLMFIVGGALPLSLALMFVVGIAKDRRRGDATATQYSIGALFNRSRWLSNLYLWVTFFLTMMTLAIMLNWLPSLIAENGHTPRASAVASGMFSLAGAFGGVLLGMAVARSSRLAVFLITYLAVMAGLALIAISDHSFPIALLGSGVSGFFLIAAQVLLYGLAPLLYPTAIRATGVGFAVAAGRSGSIAGPFLAGLTLQTGGTAATVMILMVPVIALALVSLVPVLKYVAALPVEP